jgi:hypothetical protein
VAHQLAMEHNSTNDRSGSAWIEPNLSKTHKNMLPKWKKMAVLD